MDALENFFHFIFPAVLSSVPIIIQNYDHLALSTIENQSKQIANGLFYHQAYYFIIGGIVNPVLNCRSQVRVRVTPGEMSG
jgi:hypothetical protein